MLLEKMELNRNSLAGKTAVVTGAGRGIGKELARVLAWLGAKVVIAEISNSGKDVESQISSEGGEALFVKTDVSSEKSMKNMAKKAIKAFGKVDILVNNAITLHTGSFVETSVDKWDRAYAVNLRGAILGIREFMPRMLERKEGTVVTITSSEGMPYAAPYSASKSALKSLGFSIAAELGENSGVSVFVFAPGMVNTPGLSEAFVDMAPRYGMTYDELMGQNANPGYEGAMPAEDCAAGFAHAIVHAKEFHGKIADPFYALNKFGLIGRLAQGKEQSKADVHIYYDVIKSSALRALENLKDVKSIIEATKKGFDDQNVFQRSWALRIFEQRSGLDLGRWAKTLDDLEIKLKEISAAAISKDSHKIMHSIDGLNWHIVMLGKLAVYHNQTANDAKGWIKNQETLRISLDALETREKTILALASELKSIGK
jgi:NAD(P)-dependent dehydrogenase (short-subunit alcohol dehydrogenase family)